ncbi:MAG: AlkA N-terminal domain-containing protein [Vicinamibacterales bacterium]
MDLTPQACYRALSTRDARFDGRIFVGVRSTGVYCRPICPARTPRREHVMFFPTAASAQEAGFRPCLRCRPEAAPDLAAWRGTSNTVSRALTLIELGGLDEGDVDALASRVGVGERQLRRLFREHLGASPVAVAQTRRVLLAKQLIHETRMPMSEVALASGFGSIRRFNETFQRLFHRPPMALRRVRAGARPSSGEVVLKLRYRKPYDWPAILSFLEARAIPGVERVESGVYSRTIGLEDEQGTVSVGQGRGDALHVTVRFPKLAALPRIIARLRRVFDLSAEPEAIRAHLSEDPLLARLVEQRPGLRVPGAWDGFELAVRAVLGQQVTLAAARSLAAGLIVRCGEPLEGAQAGTGLTHVFPTPRALVSLGPGALPMPAARTATLVALAHTMMQRPGLFQVGRSVNEVVADLRAIKGLGAWSAQYIALREMREPDAFPSGDVALQRAASALMGRPVNASALTVLAERWRPWRAYAAQHLWQAAVGTPRRRSRAGGPTKQLGSPL